MGLDLDIILEVRHLNQWQWRYGPNFQKGQRLEEDLFIPRNRAFYQLFEGRPLPDDLSDAVRTGIRKTWGDPPEATFTWLTFRELLRMARWVPPDLSTIYDPLVEHVRGVGKPPDEVRLILQFA